MVPGPKHDLFMSGSVLDNSPKLTSNFDGLTKGERVVSMSQNKHMICGNSTLCDKVIQLGVLDQMLRFEDHLQSIVSKAEQRMFIVRNFAHLSTLPLATII